MLQKQKKPKEESDKEENGRITQCRSEIKSNLTKYSDSPILDDLSDSKWLIFYWIETFDHFTNTFTLQPRIQFSWITKKGIFYTREAILGVFVASDTSNQIKMREI